MRSARYATCQVPTPPPSPDVTPLPRLSHLDDGALAARLSAGRGQDREAEAELCRRFSGRIRLFGLRRLRSEAAAADLVQEVLIRVLGHLRAGALRDPGQLGSFVLGTCRVAALEGVRRDVRREALLERHAAELQGSQAPPDGGEDAARLARCLEGLGARDRAVVLLTFHAGEGAEAIGAALGLTPGNVRVVRHRAVDRLRRCMGGGEERS